MITYEDIVKKLGFDPINNPRKFDNPAPYEDDSIPSPYRILNEEEKDFLLEKMLEAKKQGSLHPTVA